MTRNRPARRPATGPVYYLAVWAAATLITLPIIVLGIAACGGPVNWTGGLAAAALIGLGSVAAGIVTADRASDE